MGNTICLASQEKHNPFHEPLAERIAIIRPGYLLNSVIHPVRENLKVKLINFLSGDTKRVLLPTAHGL